LERKQALKKEAKDLAQRAKTQKEAAAQALAISSILML
jgi:hypothetical protein